MPFVSAPNIIQTEFRYTLFGQQTENRIMVDNLAAVDAAACEAVATLCWDWWELTYSPLITANCTLREVVATDETADDGPQFIYAPDTTTVGTGSGSALPNEVSLCLSLRSASRGRSARGRWYTAGIPNNIMADANNVNSTYASAIVSAMQTLINSIAASDRALVIVSYEHNKVPRPGGPVYYTVEACTLVDTVVDSQRRRKPGVGS